MVDIVDVDVGASLRLSSALGSHNVISISVGRSDRCDQSNDFLARPGRGRTDRTAERVCAALGQLNGHRRVEACAATDDVLLLCSPGLRAGSWRSSSAPNGDA